MIRTFRGFRAACALSLLLGGAAITAPARATDLDADDYSAGALPVGTNLALVYLQHVERDQVNVDGNKVANGDLDSDVAILRYAHFVKIGPFLADPQFLLPIGRLRGRADQRGLGSSGTQVGDLILAATIWLHNDPKAGQYFGVTPFIYVPVGNYDRHQTLNLGENRWKFTAQAAGVTPVFTKKLALQVSGDVTFYTPNSSYGALDQRLTQKPLVQLQEWLMYKVNDKFDLRAGSSQFFGGKQRVDGIDVTNSRTETVNFKVGFGWNFAKSWNLVALYGRDLGTENGFREANRVNLRILKAF